MLLRYIKSKDADQPAKLHNLKTAIAIHCYILISYTREKHASTNKSQLKTNKKTKQTGKMVACYVRFNF